MNDTVPVPRSLLVRLWLALLVAGLSLAVSLVQGALQPDYDAWHQAVSALSLGPNGWIQQLNFIVFGAAVLSTAPVWRQILAGGRGAAAYPVATALTAVGLMIAGLVPQDPAPGYDPEGLHLQAPTTHGLVHLAAAGVAAVCSGAALVVMGRRFAGDPHWRGWQTYTRGMALLALACIVVYGVWSTRASGYAGTFERLALLVTPVWGFTLLRRLSAGIPFMNATALLDAQHDPANVAEVVDVRP